jgi:predicted sulfurtransferase/23S rRNA-/tRNA-specific pseudouridylate synthase
MASTANQQTKENEDSHIILFYRYHELSSDRDLMELYRSTMHRLCEALRLNGRILIGCSDKSEGINGTLAGNHDDVKLFTYALLGKEYLDNEQSTIHLDTENVSILSAFWIECKAFADRAGVNVLTMQSPDDFKWSKSHKQSLFPDLNIKLVKEMIGTGGILSSIEVGDTSKGYLTPEQFHTELQFLNSKDTILIDCRNTKECQIGHFPNAIDPNTTTFAQFPHWVKQNEGRLASKKILMYCTGGIRCEKASQFIRTQVDSIQSVHHLKGGIHKYLEQYGNEGLWQGKNFVFDGRGAASGSETKAGKYENDENIETDNNQGITIVGKCLYCNVPHDTFHPLCVCTVCREPTLVCDACRSTTLEYHCKDHFHLKNCYFSNLSRFDMDQLKLQLSDLEEWIEAIAVGKRYKQKRKTLQKQIFKICDQLLQTDTLDTGKQSSTICRNCGVGECSGRCWGFHGLKRKELLEIRQNNNIGPSPSKKARQSRMSSNQRNCKLDQKERSIAEILILGLSKPPAIYRDVISGLRVPPPCIRLLQTLVKGKWCGKTARQLAEEEFPELSKNLSSVTKNGLLKVNDNTNIDIRLKNMDQISRIVHWHEPPVIVPENIHVQKIVLEKVVIDDYDLVASEHNTLEVYVCNKPSSVPVHPAGPYFSNTLTMMVEAQEGLKPRSLIPCHRIDRVTSGLTICCTNVGVARLLQSNMDHGRVRKLYLAKVGGYFPSTLDEFTTRTTLKLPDFATIDFLDESFQISAPIETIDAAAGIRIASKTGKPSVSRFRRLAYDDKLHTSLLSCYPMTGRGHQLRVHLQLFGFPIVDDLQYGGSLVTSGLMNRAIKQICQAVSSENKTIISSNLLSAAEAASAKSICRCCNYGEQGVVESFSQSQLLDSGHSISLHAVKYELSIPRKPRRKISVEGYDDVTKVLFTVGVPDWAISMDRSKLCWL